jgi:hypothetical protein
MAEVPDGVIPAFPAQRISEYRRFAVKVVKDELATIAPAVALPLNHNHDLLTSP